MGCTVYGDSMYALSTWYLCTLYGCVCVCVCVCLCVFILHTDTIMLNSQPTVYTLICTVHAFTVTNSSTVYSTVYSYIYIVPLTMYHYPYVLQCTQYLLCTGHIYAHLFWYDKHVTYILCMAASAALFLRSLYCELYWLWISVLSYGMVQIASYPVVWLVSPITSCSPR